MPIELCRKGTIFEEPYRELPSDERERGSGDEVLRIGLRGAHRVRLFGRKLSRVAWSVNLAIWMRSLCSVVDGETLLTDQ